MGPSGVVTPCVAHVSRYVARHMQFFFRTFHPVLSASKRDTRRSGTTFGLTLRSP